MKAKYELTIVLPVDDKKLLSEVKGLVEDFVTKSKGKVAKTESWGVKTLAYPINKNTKALYEFFVIEIDSVKQPELHKLLNLKEGILRYLFVRV